MGQKLPISWCFEIINSILQSLVPSAISLTQNHLQKKAGLASGFFISGSSKLFVHMKMLRFPVSVTVIRFVSAMIFGFY